MAITKILHMKDSAKPYHGYHLKTAIDYILASEKTQGGVLAESYNCNVDTAFHEMRTTKESFQKNNQRQGYHVILSFQEEEVSATTALEITRKFVKEFLGERYETVYAVHDNTEHIHAHIIFNSVSFVDGRKFHYKKGDWERVIQPITNRICEAYGISTIHVEGERSTKENYQSWEKVSEQTSEQTFQKMIRRDVDACILQASTFDSFLEGLKEKGYEIKQGKHLAIKAPEMKRFRRLKTLGAGYGEEAIVERIEQEGLRYYKREAMRSPRIVPCYVKRYRRGNITGLQKKYFAKLYRLGKIKKRPYSQAWKYKADIATMKQLQQQYLFLYRYGIKNSDDLEDILMFFTEERKAVNQEIWNIRKEEKQYQDLFESYDRVVELEAAHLAYESGDLFFEQEEQEWCFQMEALKKDGYSLQEVKSLKEQFQWKKKESYIKGSEIRKQISCGKKIKENLYDKNWNKGYEVKETKKVEEIQQTKNR